MKHRKIKTLSVLAVLLVVGSFTRIFGPLDTFPRIDQSVMSSDSAWTVTIYRHKSSALSLSAPTQMKVKVENARGQIVYLSGLWRFKSPASWDTFSGKDEMFISFESDAIVLTRRPYEGENHSGWLWRIKHSELAAE